MSNLRLQTRAPETRLLQRRLPRNTMRYLLIFLGCIEHQGPRIRLSMQKACIMSNECPVICSW